MNQDFHEQLPSAGESPTNQSTAPRSAIRDHFGRIAELSPKCDWLVFFLGSLLAIKLVLFAFGAKAVLALTNRLPPRISTQSAPRYILALFRVFILFGMAARNRVLNTLIAMWLLLLLGLFSSMFTHGWWAF